MSEENKIKLLENYISEHKKMTDSVIEILQQENTQLKQQLKETNSCLNLQIANVTLLEKELKDKDEKISNLIKLLIEMVFDDIDYLGVYQELVARHLVKLGYIVKEDGYYKELESNKED